jgi:DNA gyrase inhibitor GyrI
MEYNSEVFASRKPLPSVAPAFLRVRIEQFPGQSIVYMRRTGAYGVENYALMAALKNWVKDKGLFENSVIYAIARDNPEVTPPEQCRYDVCFVAGAETPVDGAIKRGEIPGGKYAVFTIPHSVEAVHDFWSSVFQVLQDNGLQFDMVKPIMERYKQKLVEDGFCEFYVPIL